MDSGLLRYDVSHCVNVSWYFKETYTVIFYSSWTVWPLKMKALHSFKRSGPRTKHPQKLHCENFLFILSCSWIQCGKAERLDQLDSHPYDDGCKICDINLLKPSGFFTYHQVLTFKNSTWRSLCAECSVRISEQTATFALSSINCLVFITLVEGVYCVVQTHSLYKADYVSSLKG